MDLKSRVVIVTGAASGIGEAAAELLWQAGASIVLADRDAQRIEALGRRFGDALALPTDVRCDADVDALVAATLARHGAIHGLVNNAGVDLHCPVEQLDLEQFGRALQVNVVGALRMMQAVLPTMRRAGFGRIVNVSSGTTRMVPVGAGPYSATKAALNMLSAVARKEWEDDGIRVSIVLPSITATRFRGGHYKLGEESWPGLVTHSASYPAKAILRALRTGEEAIDVPHGPERADAFALPSE